MIQNGEKQFIMTNVEQQIAANTFAYEWKNRGDEKSETQSFWTSLLQSVFGIAEPQKFIEFENRVRRGIVKSIC